MKFRELFVCPVKSLWAQSGASYTWQCQVGTLRYRWGLPRWKPPPPSSKMCFYFLLLLFFFKPCLKFLSLFAATVSPLCTLLTWCMFLQALMHYAGSRNSIEHGLPLLEVYCLSINCFAAARSHLTAESDRVALVLKRLALWVQTLPHHLFSQQILFNWPEWYSRQWTALAPNYCFYVQFFFFVFCALRKLCFG